MRHDIVTELDVAPDVLHEHRKKVRVIQNLDGYAQRLEGELEDEENTAFGGIITCYERSQVAVDLANLR